MFKQIIYVVKRVLEAILLVGAYLETFGTAVGQKGHFLRREVYAKSHCGIGRDRGENLFKEIRTDLDRQHEAVEFIVAVDVGERA